MFYKNIKNHATQFLGSYRQENPATYAAAQQAIGGLLIADGLVGIDNPFGGKKRSGIFGSLIGIAVGLFFVFGASFMGNLFGVNKLTAVTTAKVVSVSQPSATTKNSDGSSSGGSCTAQASYTVNGNEYTQTSSSGSSSICSLTQGQEIKISYDPSNPGAWAYDLDTVKTILKIFPIVGLLVALSSLATFVIRLLSIIFGWKILQSGRALAKTLPPGTDLATVKSEIEQNFAKSVFGIGGNSQPPSMQTPPSQNPPASPPAGPAAL